MRKGILPVLIAAFAAMAPVAARADIKPPYPYFAKYGVFQQDMADAIDNASYNPAMQEILSKIVGGHCPPPPSPPADLNLSSVYDRSDSSRSRVDPESFETYKSEIRGIRLFETQLIELTNAAIRTRNENRILYAECALRWMNVWQKKRVYLGQVNAQGGFVRQWALSVLANAYFQINQVITPKPFVKKGIEGWLRRISDTVISDFDRNAGLARGNNNHLYWAAWGVTSVGIALDDADYYEWGTDAVRKALSKQVQADGTLPYELMRGKKALQYHNFSLTPILLVAQTMRSNNDDLTQEEEAALKRLVRLTFSGIKNPGAFEKLTGLEQDSLKDIAASHFAWVEIYNSWYPNIEMAAFLIPYRPIRSTRAGGDMTYLFVK